MKESNEKIAVVSSAEELQHIDLDCRFVAKQIAVMQKSDTIDESTGEVIALDTIGSVLFEKGHELSQNDISALLFHFQVRDIEEIYLSNKQRLGTVQGKAKEIWTVKARMLGANKTQKLMLKANSALQAYEIAKDYIELNYKGLFFIQGIKTFDDSMVLEPDENETNISVDRHWYRLMVEEWFENGGGSKLEHSFVVYAENVDAAKMLIDRYAAKRKAEDKFLEPIILKIKTASIISCDVVVPFDFCQAYNDEHKEEE